MKQKEKQEILLSDFTTVIMISDFCEIERINNCTFSDFEIKKKKKPDYSKRVCNIQTILNQLILIY